MVSLARSADYSSEYLSLLETSFESFRIFPLGIEKSSTFLLMMMTGHYVRARTLKTTYPLILQLKLVKQCAGKIYK